MLGHTDASESRSAKAKGHAIELSAGSASADVEGTGGVEPSTENNIMFLFNARVIPISKAQKVDCEKSVDKKVRTVSQSRKCCSISLYQLD